jgi:hypothetical protein
MTAPCTKTGRYVFAGGFGSGAGRSIAAVWRVGGQPVCREGVGRRHARAVAGDSGEELLPAQGEGTQWLLCGDGGCPRDVAKQRDLAEAVSPVKERPGRTLYAHRAGPRWSSVDYMEQLIVTQPVLVLEGQRWVKHRPPEAFRPPHQAGRERRPRNIRSRTSPVARTPGTCPVPAGTGCGRRKGLRPYA